MENFNLRYKSGTPILPEVMTAIASGEAFPLPEVFFSNSQIRNIMEGNVRYLDIDELKSMNSFVDQLDNFLVKAQNNLVNSNELDKEIDKVGEKLERVLIQLGGIDYSKESIDRSVLPHVLLFILSLGTLVYPKIAPYFITVAGLPLAIKLTLLVKEDILQKKFDKLIENREELSEEAEAELSELYLHVVNLSLQVVAKNAEMNKPGSSI